MWKGLLMTQIIFISVNTPTKTYGKGKGMAADLEIYNVCARQIAKIAKDDKIVVEKSTGTRTAEAIKAFWIAQEMEFNSRFFPIQNFG
jgi:UDPglucose 6-dehydrogenase